MLEQWINQNLEAIIFGSFLLISTIVVIIDIIRTPRHQNHFPSGFNPSEKVLARMFGQVVSCTDAGLLLDVYHERTGWEQRMFSYDIVALDISQSPRAAVTVEVFVIKGSDIKMERVVAGYRMNSSEEMRQRYGHPDQDMQQRRRR